MSFATARHFPRVLSSPCCCSFEEDDNRQRKLKGHFLFNPPPPPPLPFSFYHLTSLTQPLALHRARPPCSRCRSEIKTMKVRKAFDIFWKFSLGMWLCMYECENSGVFLCYFYANRADGTWELAGCF